MSTASMTYGNLALKDESVTQQSLEVVSGGAKTIVSRCAQVAAPDVYAAVKSASEPTNVSLLVRLALIIAASFTLMASAMFIDIRAERQTAFIDSLVQQKVVVRNGDSLWDIATEHAVNGLSTDETVEVIRMWNSLPNATLYSGMELVVPALAS